MNSGGVNLPGSQRAVVWSQPRPQPLGALLIFGALTGLMTWPLVLHLPTTVIGWVGDNFYFVWLIGWFQKSLLDLHQSPLFAPQLNYPAGWSLAYNEITPAMVLPALPFSFAGGPTLAYNTSLLASFLLSALGVYLWVFWLTRHHAAALLAGVIFAFSPYRMSHLLGHLNLMGTQWLAFFFLCLHRLLQQRTLAWRTVVLTACFLSLLAWTTPYYFVMASLLSASFAATYFWLYQIPLDRCLRIGAAYLLAALPIALALWPYWQLSTQAQTLHHTFEEVRLWSASPTDFFLPSPVHFLWGAWLKTKLDRPLWIESTLYIGIVAPLFAIVAAVLRRRVAAGGKLVGLLGVNTLVAFILALGTDFHWLGQSVSVNVPTWLQSWHPYAQTFIPLPNYFLFKFLPFYAGLRVWMRYGLFVNLFLSVLAGLGFAWLWEKKRDSASHAGLANGHKRWVNWATVLLVGVTLVDFYPGLPILSAVQVRPVDRWLAAQPQGRAVAPFPIEQAKLPEQTYFTLINHQPFIGGFFAAFEPAQFQMVETTLAHFPDAQSVALLRRLGIYYAVVDASQYPNFAGVQRQIEALGLPLVIKVDAQYVFRVAKAPGSAAP